MDLLLLIPSAIISVLIVSANATLIFIGCSVTANFQRNTNGLTMSLAVSNLVVGIVGIPAEMASSVTKRPHDLYSCTVIKLLIVWSTQIGNLHIFAVSLERYLTVRAVFPYLKLKVKRNYLLVLIPSIWLLGTFLTFIPYCFIQYMMRWAGECKFPDVVPNIYMRINFFTGFCPLMFIMGSITCSTGFGYRIQKYAQDPGSGNQDYISINCIGLLFVCLIGCWLPLYMATVVARMFHSRQYSMTVLWIFIHLSHVSFIIIPGIYIYGNKAYRKTFVRLVRRTSSAGLKGICAKSNNSGEPAADTSATNSDDPAERI